MLDSVRERVHVQVPLLVRAFLFLQVFGLLLEHLSSISLEKLINSIDFRIFGIVLVNSGLTMNDSFLSLKVLSTTWLVFGLS